jgi:hypothetical protein
MATSEADPPAADQREEPEDARDAWLSLALLDGSTAALATAARGGRPLPKKEEPQL